MEDEVTTGQGSETGTETPVAPEQTGGGDQGNPAWNDLLEVVPSQLHSLVKPHLQQWDRNYQEGINKVHSQYEPYKPYLEGNISPDQINYSLQLMQAIEQNPAEVIKALQEFAGMGEEQTTPTTEQGQVENSEVPSEFLQHPEFQKMSKMVETMAQLLVQQNQTSQQAYEDQMLSQELDNLHQQHGDFDEEWVLTRAANNPQVPLEKHVEAYKQFVNQIVTETRRPSGPRVMGAGGVAPDSQVDVKSLDASGRRAMAVQMLRAAAQNND